MINFLKFFIFLLIYLYMSQIDKLKLLPTLFWITVILYIWYFINLGYVLSVPVYYRGLCRCYTIELYIFRTIKEDEYIFQFGFFVFYKFITKFLKFY